MSEDGPTVYTWRVLANLTDVGRIWVEGAIEAFCNGEADPHEVIVDTMVHAQVSPTIVHEFSKWIDKYSNVDRSRVMFAYGPSPIAEWEALARHPVDRLHDAIDCGTLDLMFAHEEEMNMSFAVHGFMNNLLPELSRRFSVFLHKDLPGGETELSMPYVQSMPTNEEHRSVARRVRLREELRLALVEAKRRESWLDV